ncbi:MAG: hypothetical protein N3B01_00490, partial [Verrucomicrobiae bacterium]|nr:hypothetical protein [Verrucomicrobiae bacterium]
MRTRALMIAAWWMWGFHVARAAETFYVASNGNDCWSGRLASPNHRRTDGPFATLARAQEAVRALKAGGELKGPVTVRIRGGVYRLSKPLVFTPADSGSERCPVVYAAAPGERVGRTGVYPVSYTH